MHCTISRRIMVPTSVAISVARGNAFHTAKQRHQITVAARLVKLSKYSNNQNDDVDVREACALRRSRPRIPTLATGAARVVVGAVG
jgi:hypothetical protein